MSKTYSVTQQVSVAPDDVDAAVTELTDVNDVRVVDAKQGLIEVDQQVIAPDDYVAFALAYRYLQAALARGAVTINEVTTAEDRPPQIVATR